jgi:hypothetical protein
MIDYRFLHLEVTERIENAKIENGKRVRKEALIFPRFHQVDAVRKLVADARANGPGRHYLIQHSAASGKGNSIAWLAHRLSTLHDGQVRKVFDSVIILPVRSSACHERCPSISSAPSSTPCLPPALSTPSSTKSKPRPTTAARTSASPSGAASVAVTAASCPPTSSGARALLPTPRSTLPRAAP